MNANRISNRRPQPGVQRIKVVNRILGKDDLIGHLIIVTYFWPNDNGSS